MRFFVVRLQEDLNSFVYNRLIQRVNMSKIFIFAKDKYYCVVMHKKINESIKGFILCTHLIIESIKEQSADLNQNKHRGVPRDVWYPCKQCTWLYQHKIKMDNLNKNRTT